MEEGNGQSVRADQHMRKRRPLKLTTGRRPALNFMRLLLLLQLLLSSFCVYAQDNNDYYYDSASTSCAPPASSNAYEWEQYNYYEILNLQPPDKKQKLPSRKKRRKQRSSITSADIRKAYRKQAQLYHPDKLAGKRLKKEANNSSSTSTNGSSDDKSNSTTTTLTQEESTARFSRIAEAYEVLSDAEKREEYDDFLLHCEDRLAARTQQEQGTADTSFFENLSTDPLRVFEEFFFGSSSSSQQQQQQQYAAPNEWEYNDSGDPRRSSSSPPHRVYEREEFRYDPYHRVEILRMLRTEEYDMDPNTGRYYYRVIGQDFVKQHDPFYGWEYQPITELFLVQEGYRHDNGDNEYSHHEHDPNREIKSMLFPGEFLVPNSDVLTSSNRRYYAGLSAECELIIMSDSSRLGPNVDDFVVWSSETYVPSARLVRAGGCFLAMRGPHLVLALGNPDRPGSILWYSEASPTVMAEEEIAQRFGQNPTAPTYFARLDDDGSLAVYSERIVPIQEDDSSSRSSTVPFSDPDESSWWVRLKTKTTAPRTRAAKAWVSVRKWTSRTVLRRGGENEGYSSRQQHSSSEKLSAKREVCIYATGPAGCNTPARRILHKASDVTRSVKHKMKHTMTKLDNAIDDFVDSLSEGEEEDEDILDTLLRLLSKAGSGIGRAGQKVARRSAQVVRKTIQERLYRRKQQ